MIGFSPPFLVSLSLFLFLFLSFSSALNLLPIFIDLKELRYAKLNEYFEHETLTWLIQYYY